MDCETLIFNKILEGTDLAFNIQIGKTEYGPGETVSGVVSVKAEKVTNVRGLTFMVEGKEETEISSSNMFYRKSNVFLSKDLSQLLRESVISNILQDGTIDILPQNREVLFEFALPSRGLLSSYKGKNAKITYMIKIVAERPKRRDINREEPLSVKNVSTFKKAQASNGDCASNIKNNLSSIEKLNTGYTSSYPLNFRRKDRNYFLSENREARIQFTERHEAGDVLYSPGETINGKIILHNPETKKERQKSIRGLSISLSGIEYAVAGEYEQVNRIENYEQDLEVSQDRNITEDENYSIPFEIQIPAGVHQSYIGKYSEYFWGLEVKMNRAWSSDITARTIIKII